MRMGSEVYNITTTPVTPVHQIFFFFLCVCENKIPPWDGIIFLTSLLITKINKSVLQN